MMRGPVGLAMLALLVSGCRAAGPEAVGAPDGAAGTPRAAVEGVVRVVGSAPMDVHVVVQPADGAAVRVVGDVQDEIRRLSGAVVRLEGPLEESAMPVARQQIRVTDYEIVSVNGRPVIQGVVEGTMGEWTMLRTKEDEIVYLASVPEGIRTGQKIWVQGPPAVVVQSHGVLRQ